MNLKAIFKLFLGLMLIISVPASVSAYDQPSLNLGFTSFMDGAPPSGPGLYFTQYLQYWTSDDFKDGSGNALFPAGTGEELDAWISLSQFIYQSDTEVMLGAKWGIDVIVPYVMLDMQYGNYLAGFPQDDGSGPGDLWIGPYLQWDPVMGDDGPKFMHRIEFQFIFPTGDYNELRALNPGSNFFSFNPYWAATYFVTPRFTLSTRIHYLYNNQNTEPNSALGVKETQAGNAIHLNFASSYEVMPNQLRLGINGYYLKQLSENEYDGVEQVDSEEKVFAIGPGALYSFNKDAHLFFNLYFESDAENRPEGKRFNCRFVYHF